VLVDGKKVGDVGADVQRDRQLLAEDGMAVVAVTVDAEGRVVAGPALATRGWVFERVSAALLVEATLAVRAALAAREPPPGEGPLPRPELEAVLRGAVRRFVKARFGRKPVVVPLVLTLGEPPGDAPGGAAGR
jgi:ribonuclease J